MEIWKIAGIVITLAYLPACAILIRKRWIDRGDTLIPLLCLVVTLSFYPLIGPRPLSLTGLFRFLVAIEFLMLAVGTAIPFMTIANRHQESLGVLFALITGWFASYIILIIVAETAL